MCFAVLQSDKVRRCEDFRKSAHNATVRADACPHYYSDVESYVAVIRHLGYSGSLVWGQDLSVALERQHTLR